MEKTTTTVTTGALLAAPITDATRAAIVSAIEVSYVPKFFVKKAIELHQENLGDYIKKEQLDISSDIVKYISTKLVGGSFVLYSTELHTVYTLDKFSWFKRIPKLLFDFLYIVSGKKKKNEAKEKYNKLYEEIKKKYTDYEKNHEVHLMKIQSSIDIINKVKPILKDYILKKLSLALNEMGIDSKVSDYPMEHLDYRNFPLKEEFNIIAVRKLTMEKNLNLLEEVIYNHPYLWVLNFVKANELIKRIKILQHDEKLTAEKIQADLTQLEAFDIALDNIANIFIDTKDVFVPLIEKIISDIKTQYNSQYDAIPDKVLLLMQSSSKILKDLAEKNILKGNFALADIEKVEKYNNNLSIKYNELKDTILKMAS